MSYMKKVKWHVVPAALPQIKKHCPKCSDKSVFINTERFRVNANGNAIDIWMIFQCEKCRATWNMTVHERIRPDSLTGEIYERYTNNDMALIRTTAFDKSIYTGNGVQMMFDNVVIDIEGEISEELTDQAFEVEIEPEYPLDIRVEKVLAQKMDISRSKLRKMVQEGMIESRSGSKLLKQKLTVVTTVYVCPAH